MTLGRSDLADFSSFLTIARHRSFRLAALELGVSPSALSHALKTLEERLGIRLVNRTNRSVTLTAAGQELQDAIAQPYAAIGQAVDNLNRYRDAPTGRIRINAIVDAVQLVLAPVLPEFARRYPNMEVEIAASNRMVDIIGSGFDAGIRHGGTVPEDLIAQRISGDLRWVVAAAPSYIGRFGIPRHPRDLEAHHCLGVRLGDDRVYRWEFMGEDGEFAVTAPSKIYVDEGRAMLSLALAGTGLMYGPAPIFSPYLVNGTLQLVLEDWATTGPGYELYYSSRRQVPTGLKLLVELIREMRPLGP